MKAFKLAAAGAAVVVAGVAAWSAWSVPATPARAGWQFTEWGMTADEVVAAGKGRVVRRSAEALAQDKAIEDREAAEGVERPTVRCSHRLREPLTVGSIVFDDVRFCFSAEGRLKTVSYRSKANPEVVAQVLEASLGPPIDVHKGVARFWTFVDRERGNTVFLAYDPDNHDPLVVVYVEKKPGE